MARGAGADAAQVIAVVAWIASHPDGVEVAEVCRRFGLSAEEVVRLIEMASMIGADSPEFTDMPFLAYAEGDRVHAQLFNLSRPLALTPAQGLALLAAGRALAPGGDDALSRGLAKLADVLGVDGTEGLEVDLGRADDEVLATLRAAVRDQRAVDISYWSAARDTVTQRRVEPWRVFSDVGAWYLQAWCQRAEGRRHFRLDRISRLALTDEAITPPKALGNPVAYQAAAEDARVTLALPAELAWVPETVAIDEVVSDADGGLVVTLPAGGRAWLARFLLRLGPEVEVVEIDERLGDSDLAAKAAEHLLVRYEKDVDQAG